MLLLSLVIFFGMATAFGARERLRSEEPLRALLGPEYDAVLSGKSSAHYMGQNRRFPEPELKDIHGKGFSQKDFKGKTLFLNVWSKTCKPCIEEMPSIEALAQRHAQNPKVVVATLCVDDSWDAVRVVHSKESQAVMLLDPNGAWSKQHLGTRLYPETWIVDSKGIIRLRIDGARDWSHPIVDDLLERY